MIKHNNKIVPTIPVMIQMMTPMTNYTRAIEKKHLLKKSENIPNTTMKYNNKIVPTTLVIIQIMIPITNYTRAIGKKKLVVKKIQQNSTSNFSDYLNDNSSDKIT
ncbi:21626_t:CDS:1 [Dentiscutata erythropus]|uniref:21626_t:CDS:1 n=1 Tax=Dentiscutata erythropus TaxID=1348616 RepID=A0A9N9FN48_9GLOM|nr:21626_t:CDS:1 [Dentiscutata erythropus]